MSDSLIDRQGAIEHAKTFWDNNDGDSAMQMIIDYLRTVPSPPEATKKQGRDEETR